VNVTYLRTEVISANGYRIEREEDDNNTEEER
jgi:hypothetical protein